MSNPVNWINDYFNILMSHKERFEKDVSKGKMDIDKAIRLTEKLNDWYMQAKLLAKISRK